jgi:hypothetical protein
MNLFHHGKPSDSLRHLACLAAELGISAEMVDVARLRDLALLVKEAASSDSGLVLDVASLSGAGDPAEVSELAPFLADGKASVLLLVTAAGSHVSRLLAVLTGRIVAAVEGGPSATRVAFPTIGRTSSGALAGQSYSRTSGEALNLSLGNSADSEVVMELDGLPAFARFGGGRGAVFVWSTPQVFDMKHPIAAELEFEEAADAYIPAIIFLREAFGDRCWHNPRIGAGLVIDDPLLVRRYGLLDFPKLLASARAHRYHVTLAFIPWNHRRSRPENVRLFLEHADCFSLCAHGCDHTKNEFSSADYDDLLQRNIAARERMEDHRQRTGLPCEPLMVCPQEQYSLEGIRAFADSRQFLALVNTGCQPRNLRKPSICGADLLRPVQDAFFGFPVFKRHYWKDMAAFAMAVFLGKPAILVEHHEFFASGPGGVETFAARLRELHPAIAWGPLLEVVTGTHWRREVGAGSYEVRFFSDSFRLEPAGPGDYRFFKRFPEATLVREITVNGRSVPFTRQGADLAFNVRLEAAGPITVKVEIPPVFPARRDRLGVKYRALVAVRRGLSEFRDNVVSRNGALLRAGTLLAKSMKQTGG